MPDQRIFDALRDLIAPYAKDMIVKSDTATNYYLEETTSSQKPQMFGAVQAKKTYISFHLFPVYTHPDLLDELSPELKKRMQGKSCFNFKTTDQVLELELKELVGRAFELIK